MKANTMNPDQTAPKCGSLVFALKRADDNCCDCQVKCYYTIFAHRKSQGQVKGQMILKRTLYTVKPVQSGHSKTDKTKILTTNGS